MSLPHLTLPRPLESRTGELWRTALVGRGADGKLLVMVPLVVGDDDDDDEGAWAVGEFDGAEAQELLAKLDRARSGASGVAS